ncbi:MAG TPA: hypothetical protein VF599_04400 [Pyrinomonadaceae bacterium]|jgi:hypothetical protein
MPEYYGKYIFLFIAVIVFTAPACRPPNIGGAGWDEEQAVEEAGRYPAIESSRISVATEVVPFKTFKQEFHTVFQDFPYSGNPISSGGAESTKTQISGTPYSVSYENYVLKILRDDVLIAERKLPRVFYMHPMSSGGNSRKVTSRRHYSVQNQFERNDGTALYFYP